VRGVADHGRWRSAPLGRGISMLRGTARRPLAASQVADAIIPTPHILGEIHACVVGKHAAISNSNSQFAAPYLAHTDLVAHALDTWIDVSPKPDLADADGAALARRARPAKPIADDLPHGVQPQTSRHHGVAEKVTVEKPEARGDYPAQR